MISLDSDYISLKPYLEAECKRRGLPFEFKELNASPAHWGDVMFLGLDGIHNVEIKQAGEYIGDVGHCINQIKAQVENSEHVWLFIYGEQRRAEDGNSYSLKLDKAWESWTSRAGIDTGWVESYSRRYHRVNHDGQRKILWRFREVGVQVIEVRNLEELASELCLLYEAAQTEGSTFSRLIKEKIRVAETDPARAAFMRQLMGLEAGIGEEVADAIASCLRGDGDYPLTLASLIGLLHQHDYSLAIEEQMLRNGKRRIGSVAVARLKTALGL